jgi:hypothetical protein
MTDAIEIDPSICFSYQSSFYPANRYYQGSFKFTKHFYERSGDMNSEEECAITIDIPSNVRY